MTGSGRPAGSDGPPETVRLGVNLTWLVPGVVGGSEDYVVGLLTALAEGPAAAGLTEPDPPLEVVLFVNRTAADHHRDLFAPFEVVVAPVSGRSKAARVAADNTWLPWALRRHRIGVVHHVGGVVPFVDAGPVGPAARVLTVHDLQPLDLPENFSRTKRMFERVALPWSVRRADLITTLGTHVATSVHGRFGTPADAFALVPPGSRRPGTPATDPTAGASTGGSTADDSVLGRLGIAGHPYVLYPAITYPHKNHVVLVEAMARLAATHPDLRLVLTGGAAQCEDDLRRSITELGVSGSVVRAGRVPGDDLVALYRGAAALVFPSRYEGFGLPILEAMRLGCPVVAANSTALPEVVGGAGVLVAPGDPDGWARAIAEVVDDREVRRRLVAAGRERAAGFSWDHGATSLVAAWRRAATLGHRHVTSGAAG